VLDANPTWEGEAVIKCKKCNDEKLESAMKVRGGKPSKVCLECDKKAADERAAERDRLAKVIEDAKAETSASRKHRRKGKASAKRTRQVETDPERITMLPSLGFDAFLTDDGRLQVSQDTDNVVLTRMDAKAIFDKFGEWIVGEAA
jgi:hypothetical protein